jgi:hypothetical protein
VAGTMSVRREESGGTERDEGENRRTWDEPVAWDTVGQTLDESVARAEGGIEHKTSARQRPRRRVLRHPVRDGSSDRAQVAVTVMLSVRDVALIRIRCIAIAWRRGEGSRGRTDGGALSALGVNERAGYG